MLDLALGLTETCAGAAVAGPIVYTAGPALAPR